MKKIVHIHLIVVFMLLTAFTTLAQVNVDVKLDSTNLLTGDQTYFHIRLAHSSDTEVLFPSTANLGEMIEVMEYGEVNTTKGASETIVEQDILITAWDSGQHQIPPIAFPHKRVSASVDTSSNQYDTTYSNAIMFDVHTLAIEDTSYIAPIKAIISEPLAWEDFMPYLYTIAGLLFIALLIFLIYKARQNPPEPPAPIVIRPAHEVAMEQLQHLEQEQLWQKGEIKTYQSKLTYIVREYLENRFDIQALESTTNEILQQLNQEDIPTELRTKMREMLNVADLVKFAKASPPVTLNKDLMENAIYFVNTTKKIEVIPDEENPEV